MFEQEGIDARGLEAVADGKTFHWHGRYHENMNDRTTLATELNVLATHHPDVPEGLLAPDYLFLANTDPDLQMKTLSQLERPKLVLADTMNLWIELNRDSLWQMISKVDVLMINDSEAQMLCETSSNVAAARQILDTGCGRVIVKKGEHGCLMFTPESIFAAPAFPLERVHDPTGAGDSFAGAYLGYLARVDSLDEEAHRCALIAGTAVASHCCESFSVDRLQALTRSETNERMSALSEMMRFELAGMPV